MRVLQRLNRNYVFLHMFSSLSMFKILSVLQIYSLAPLAFVLIEILEMVQSICIRCRTSEH